MKLFVGFLMLMSFTLKQNVAFAQAGLIPGANDPSKADLRMLNSEQRLTHVVISPQDKSGALYVVGTKEGEVNLRDLNLFSGQMTPARGSVAEYDENNQDKPSPKHSHVIRERSKANLTVALSPIRHRAPKKVFLFTAKKHLVHTVASQSPKKVGGKSEFPLWLLLFLLIMALYAHKTGEKIKRRGQSVSIFS
jgi:hypothetical protein